MKIWKEANLTTKAVLVALLLLAIVGAVRVFSLVKTGKSLKTVFKNAMVGSDMTFVNEEDN